MCTRSTCFTNVGNYQFPPEKRPTLMLSRKTPRGLSLRSSSFHTGQNVRKRKRRRPLARLIGETLEPRMLLATAPIGDQFVVAETLGFTATPAAIAVYADGSFTTAFESFEEDGSGFGVFAQRFDPSGTP